MEITSKNHDIDNASMIIKYFILYMVEHVFSSWANIPKT